MHQPFTQQARKAIVKAQEETERMGQSYIGTEHLLLGILETEESRGSRILKEMGITIEPLQKRISEIVRNHAARSNKEIIFTPRAKRVIALALEQAMQLHTKLIGTEHLLLGITLESEGVAAHVLAEFYGRPDKAYQTVMDFILKDKSSRRGGHSSIPENMADPHEDSDVILKKGFHRIDQSSGKEITSSDQPEDAHSASSKALFIHKQNTEKHEILVKAYILKGTAISALGSEQAAKECFDIAMSVEPDNFKLWITKGDIFFSEKNYPYGEKCYDNYLEVFPDDASVWIKKGELLRAWLKIDTALKCFDKAIELGK